MTEAEITRLKEALAADYKRKLEAIELVEQMLDQQQKTQLMGTGNKVQPPKVFPRAKVSGTTLAARVEQAFQKQTTWTTPALMRAIGAKNRNSVWSTLNRLAKERKVRISRQASGRRPAEYTRVT